MCSGVGKLFALFKKTEVKLLLCNDFILYLCTFLAENIELFHRRYHVTKSHTLLWDIKFTLVKNHRGTCDTGHKPLCYIFL